MDKYARGYSAQAVAKLKAVEIDFQHARIENNPLTDQRIEENLELQIIQAQLETLITKLTSIIHVEM